MAGTAPIEDTLILTRGADFLARYDTASSDPDIAPGTTARIEITKTSKTDDPIITTWDGTVTDRYVSFRVESEETDLIKDGSHYRLLLRFPDTPTLDLCWFAGDIERKQ